MDIPESWVQSTIGKCFLEIRNGTTIKQNKEKSGIPVSRIETLQNNDFDLNRVRHISDISDENIEKFRYHMGDIALSLINSYEHVGKTAL